MGTRTTASGSNFLISDFFRNLHRERALPEAGISAYYRNLLRNRPSLHLLKVFLCGAQLGQEKTDKYFDKRIQIKRFLKSRMGCDPFLGEDIEEIKRGTTVDSDALTIEVQEATSSDLIFIFLESFGTTAELAAFVLDERIIDKLVVFNDIKYKDPKEPSFLDVGPLRLLEKRKPGSVFYYDPKWLKNGMSQEVISYLDGAIAKTWFLKSMKAGRLPAFWTFDSFITAATVFAFYPVTTKELEGLLVNRLAESQIKDALGGLMKGKILTRDGDILLPKLSLAKLPLEVPFIEDISRCRSFRLFERLKLGSTEPRFRLLLDSGTRGRGIRL